MATTFKVEDHHILQFTGNVELLLQQKTPRLSGTVNTGSYKGSAAQVVKQFGEVEFNPFNQGTDPGDWKGDTVHDDIEHHQRWLMPSDFALALADAKGDDIRLIGDPKSPYAEAMRAAYARKHDDLIIMAATNPAKTGTYDDLTDTDLPDGQIIGHDYDPGGEGEGLTVAKLIKAREMLIAANNDPGEARFLACSEKQLSDLLGSIKVTSADYNSVKALVKGEVDSFMGFKFISTERLLSTAGIRHCLAWVKSGLHFGTWNGLETHIDRRTDKNYLWQIWMSFTAGCTRTQEKKIVQVNCAE
ncbi:MAG: hypothetical protein LBC90_05765 [Candidatus Adiutrix sp.]|jgi:hypothetical protein|nr:hypothetical protein [Candidatus Adiutrix sp.]